MSAIGQAFDLVFQTKVLLTILLAAIFGLFVGAIPGLTATMAIALLVPVTFFMDPDPGGRRHGGMLGHGDLRRRHTGDSAAHAGTPSSAAYTDEAYAMTLKGEAEIALGANLLFSALGGLFGTAVLILAAPYLAEIALKFSSFEYSGWRCWG
jgi:TctA family transporter